MKRVKLSGRLVISLTLTVLSAWVVISAMNWPFKAALFPLSIGGGMFCLSLTALIMIALGKDIKPEEQDAADTGITGGNDEAAELRKTLWAFVWVVGFCLSILFLGFSISVPLFVFFYTKFQGDETWMVSIIMALLSFFLFWGIFVWLLDLPLREGLIQHWLMVP